MAADRLHDLTGLNRTIEEIALQTRVRTSYSGGGGGGMDSTLKDYIDAQDDKTRALNDARFAEVGARIDVLASKIDGLGQQIREMPRPLGFWQLAGIAASGVVALVTIFGLMADRFDGGVSAGGLVNQIRAEQSQRDASQDATLVEIGSKLDGIAAAIAAQR